MKKFAQFDSTVRRFSPDFTTIEVAYVPGVWAWDSVLYAMIFNQKTSDKIVVKVKSE